MRNNKAKACMMAVLLWVAASCSIKEDRSPCPCFLTLNLDEMVADPDYTQGLVTIMTDRIIKQDRITIADYEGRGYELEVPRRTISSMVATGHEDLWWKSDTLYAATNLEWGPVMLANAVTDCNDDDKHVDMEFHKEYCHVTFMLVGVVDAESYPFDIRLRANCNGVRMRDRKPITGKYTAYASPYNTAMYGLLMPRQDENEMVVDLLWHSPTHDYTVDDYVTTLDMGKLLRNQGYNWEKDDLDDVYVTIDVVRATATIGIKPWEDNSIEEEI